MSEKISQEEIDEFIADLARDHPGYSIDQFKTDFKAAMSRDPQFSEIRKFQKSGKNLSASPSPPISKVIEGYAFGDVLGKGSFGEVHKCKKDNKEYAVKCIDESKMSAVVEQAFADSISSRLNSKFLVRYFNKFRGPSGELYVVMELCPKGDLRSLIDFLRNINASLNPSRIGKIFVQLLLGLELMHRFKLIHRDLKPENVFADKEDNVKIGDFGCSKELDTTSQKAHTVIGTPIYESPQIIKGEDYDSSADMWALGVLMYELCMLERPFNSTNRYKLQELILAGKYPPITKARCPEELANVIYSLLNDPTKRPSAHDLLSTPVMQTYAKESGLMEFLPRSAIDRSAAPALVPSQGSSCKPSSTSAIPAFGNHPIQFIVNESNNNAYQITGGTCKWMKDVGDWAILNEEMVTGVYAMDVEFLIPEVKWIELGLISKAALTWNKSEYICESPGTCCLAYSKYYWDQARIFTGGFGEEFFGSLFPSAGKVIVRLELDLNSKILCFFVNDTQIPHIITNISPCVYFAVGAISENTVFTVKSFQRLSKPTASATLKCDSYVWK